MYKADANGLVKRGWGGILDRKGRQRGNGGGPAWKTVKRVGAGDGWTVGRRKPRVESDEKNRILLLVGNVLDYRGFCVGAAGEVGGRRKRGYHPLLDLQHMKFLQWRPQVGVAQDGPGEL